MTWMAGMAGVVALRETCCLRHHLTGWRDVAFYGMDTFMDLWNPFEKAWHNVSTFHKVLSLILFLSDLFSIRLLSLP